MIFCYQLGYMIKTRRSTDDEGFSRQRKKIFFLVQTTKVFYDINEKAISLLLRWLWHEESEVWGVTL